MKFGMNIWDEPHVGGEGEKWIAEALVGRELRAVERVMG